MISTPLQSLEAHLLRFVCEVETPLRLFTHKGSALRGAWVEALMSRACPQPRACGGAACMMPQGCPIAALVGPAEEGRERDWPGEAKIGGRAVPAVTTDEASDGPDGDLFVADITEVVITGLDADATKLVVEWWTPERGLRRVERD